jgi:hypothetical protein
MMASQQEDHVSKLATLSRRSEEEIAALRAKLAAAVKRGQEAEQQKLEQGEFLKQKVSPPLG